VNQIRQHIPAFVDTDQAPAGGAFDSLDELRAVPFVARAATLPGFHKFSIGAHGDGWVLMAEYRGGRQWWVVGYLDAPVAGLTEWDKGIYEVVDDNGARVDIAGTDVAWSCGDDVGLRDGRKMKRWRARPIRDQLDRLIDAACASPLPNADDQATVVLLLEQVRAIYRAAWDREEGR
jgi:hypothetical protein